ncbi:MAG: DUF2490 domain-containing protein, partial [Mongoliibacter sp.]|uniref:DUF2490 domain-containing protein n=1 Tax=Mongoliibacter sp. TaxID=2022438 RepID=UPI0012EF42AB
MKIKLFLLLLCSWYLPSVLKAQNTRIIDENIISWNALFINYKLTEKWGVHGEFQLRRSDFLNNPQQNLFRAGLETKIHEQVLLRIGGAYADTYPYGKVPLQASARLFPEYRVFQMIQINNPLGRVNLTHRFILEQRWIGSFINTASPKTDNYTYLNRARYMARVEYAFKNIYRGKSVPFIAGYDEIMIGFGKNIGQNIFDQNRLGILIGLDLQKRIRAEAGFISQSLLFGRLLDDKQVIQ